MRVADGCPLKVTEMTRSVRISLHTNSGRVKLHHFSLAVMPGTDDMLILGCPILEMLGLDIYAGMTECARGRVRRRGKSTKTMKYIAYRRSRLWVGALQQQPMDEQVLDQAMDHVL